MKRGPIVVKVGGSLYTLPDLKTKLRHFLNRLETNNVLIVPGGGGAADVIRSLDQTHGIGEESSHWLALRSLTLNAHFLGWLLPEAEVIAGSETELKRDRNAWAIVDAHAFAVEDEQRADHLPHIWQATSDSVAARIAVVADAQQLVLLKAAAAPANKSWQQLADREIVDNVFPQLVQQLEDHMSTRIVAFCDSKEHIEPAPSPSCR